MLLYKSPFTALHIAIKAIEVIMMSLLCNNNCSVYTSVQVSNICLISPWAALITTHKIISLYLHFILPVQLQWKSIS